MLLQVLSDLHLEVGQQYDSFDVHAKAPYLILCGDVGRLADYGALLGFLERQCEKFTQVLMVLGNHEMYGSSRQAVLAAAKQLESEPRLQDRFTILNQTRVDLSTEVSILGCTLHSHISDMSRGIVEKTLKDFTRTQSWTVDNHNAQHAEDVTWLRAQIKQIRDNEDSSSKHPGQHRKIVVVTHHAPSRSQTSKPAHEKTPWSDGFATDLLTGSAHTNPLLCCNWWLFGHTHYTNYFEIGSLKLFSNQRGYVFPWQDSENKDPSKRPSKMVWLQGSTGLRLLMAQFRSHSKYEKQIEHQFDVGATIDV